MNFSLYRDEAFDEPLADRSGLLGRPEWIFAHLVPLLWRAEFHVDVVLEAFGVDGADVDALVDELMRPSAYHEPFFFRGIYLTGDSGESAQTVAAIDAQHDAYGHKDLEPIGGDLIAQLMRQPAFLRDLFEKKIFLEYGLTRPSRTQTLTRPVLHRALRWAAVIVPVLWRMR